MPAFIDIVKGQAVSIANQGLQKALGNLPGVIGSALNRGEPTNNDRLYINKFLVTSQGSEIAENDTLEIPACRVVLRGFAMLEKEYINIMRLKRSYELAQRVD